MRKFKTYELVHIAMLAAVAIVLMEFQISVPFAPPFYKIDFSEMPALIGSFALGPIQGMVIVMIKNLIHLSHSSTMGVGEVANCVMGFALCLPAGILYRYKRTKKCAIIGMSVGVVVMTIAACFLNAFVLLPAYAKAFHMPMDALVGMGTAVNASIDGLLTFVLLAVVPVNLIKGILNAVIVALIYKRIRPLFNLGHH